MYDFGEILSNFPAKAKNLTGLQHIKDVIGIQLIK